MVLWSGFSAPPHLTGSNEQTTLVEPLFFVLQTLRFFYWNNISQSLRNGHEIVRPKRPIEILL